MSRENVHILTHPLLQHKLTILRDETTGVKEFREIVAEMATLMCYEATRELPLEETPIQTPVGRAIGYVIAGKSWPLCRFCGPGLVWSTGFLP